MKTRIINKKILIVITARKKNKVKLILILKKAYN